MTAPIASGWSESPGGPCTHWKAPPFHGARRNRPLHDLVAFREGIRLEKNPPRATGCRRTPRRSHVGTSQPVADNSARGAPRTGMSGPARQASKRGMPRRRPVSACQRSSAINHRMRSPFAPPGHHLRLPKRLKGAILASSRRESGEHPFNRIQASHTWGCKHSAKGGSYVRHPRVDHSAAH